MKHYTSQIPLPLAEKLKEKGMPITMSNHLHQIAPDIRGVVKANFKEIDCPTYAEVFDWLLEQEIYITIELSQIKADLHIASIHKKCRYDSAEQGTWHEAANKAIERALTLI